MKITRDIVRSKAQLVDYLIYAINPISMFGKTIEAGRNQIGSEI